MPNITIRIGGRDFDVACQDGEEAFLQSAAKLLDEEAQVLVRQIGRLPESQMLLMAGLMLADKTAGMEDKLGEAQAKAATLQAELDAREPDGEGGGEVPLDALSALADRAEALAAQIEAKAR